MIGANGSAHAEEGECPPLVDPAPASLGVGTWQGGGAQEAGRACHPSVGPEHRPAELSREQTLVGVPAGALTDRAPGAP